MRRLSLVLLLAAAGCGDEPSPIGEGDDAGAGSPDQIAQTDGAMARLDLLEVAVEAGFHRFVAAVRAAGLESALTGPGPTFVAAPTDDGFRGFEPPEDPRLLAAVLRGHIGPDSDPWRTAADITFPRDGERVGDVLRAGEERAASNGRLAPIRGVLSPVVGEMGKVRSDLSWFATMIEGASTLAQDPLFSRSPVTVFVPRDASLPGVTPDRVIGAHVAPGLLFAEDLLEGSTVTLLDGSTVEVRGGLLVDGEIEAAIVESDIGFINGVVHVIDRPLDPTGRTAINIIETARAAGATALADLIASTGLSSILTGDGPFTLFAPTDEAIAAARWLPMSPELRQPIRTTRSSFALTQLIVPFPVKRVRV